MELVDFSYEHRTTSAVQPQRGSVKMKYFFSTSLKNNGKSFEFNKDYLVTPRTKKTKINLILQSFVRRDEFVLSSEM